MFGRTMPKTRKLPTLQRRITVSVVLTNQEVLLSGARYGGSNNIIAVAVVLQHILKRFLPPLTSLILHADTHVDTRRECLVHNHVHQRQNLNPEDSNTRNWFDRSTSKRVCVSVCVCVRERLRYCCVS